MENGKERPREKNRRRQRATEREISIASQLLHWTPEKQGATEKAVYKEMDQESMSNGHGDDSFFFTEQVDIPMCAFCPASLYITVSVILGQFAYFEGYILNNYRRRHVQRSLARTSQIPARCVQSGALPLPRTRELFVEFSPARW